jgi:TolA-binding protein
MTAPFDAADWLRRFADAGGYVMPAPDGRVAAGWSLDDEDQMARARAIWAEIDPYPERRAALRQMVRGATSVDLE